MLARERMALDSHHFNGKNGANELLRVICAICLGLAAVLKKWSFPIRIFMAHEPDLPEHLDTLQFDLALFGHTHAGQVYVPILTEIIVGKYRHGLYWKGKVPVYVNAGIGLEGYLAPRIRWFTFPEIAIIDIVPRGIGE
jgi:predicted MPP superfamily phosphohydrolase